MGYQFLGTIGASTMHTTDATSQKTLQRGETPQGTTRLKLLATSQGTNSLGYDSAQALSDSYDTTPLNPLARAWVLTNYNLWVYIPSIGQQIIFFLETIRFTQVSTYSRFLKRVRQLSGTQGCTGCHFASLWFSKIFLSTSFDTRSGLPTCHFFSPTIRINARKGVPT